MKNGWAWFWFCLFLIALCGDLSMSVTKSIICAALFYVFGSIATAGALIGITWILSGCSPRAYREVNKQAPNPPYAEQRPSYLEGAQYLRVEEPLDQ